MAAAATAGVSNPIRRNRNGQHIIEKGPEQILADSQKTVTAPSCMANGNFFNPLLIKTTSAVCMAICEASLM